MSLLMDALKRAERARGAQDGDNKDEDAPGLGETQGLTLDPLEFSPPKEFDDELDLTGAQEPGSGAAGTGSMQRDAAGTSGADSSVGAPQEESSLSLEPRPDVDSTGMFDLPTQRPGDDQRDPLFDSGPHDAPDPGASSPRLGLEGENQMLTDDTSATLPSVRAAQESVDSYFDGTRSISISLGAVRGAIDDDTLTSEREGMDTGRQRSAANTVLAANQSRRGSTNWTAVAVLPLLILSVVAVAGYVYWDTLIDIFGDGQDIATAQARNPAPLPRTPAAPAPQAPAAPAAQNQTIAAAPASGATNTGAAQTAAPASPAGSSSLASTGSGVQQGSAAAPTPAAAPAPSTSAATGVTPAAPAPASSTPAEPAATQSTLSAASANTAATDQGAQAPTSGEFRAAPTVAEVMTPAAPASGGTGGPRSGQEAVLGTPDPAVLQRLNAAVEGQELVGAGSAIRIARRSVPARVNPLIQRGYEALQAGDLNRAQRAYRQVLRSQPRNRDAMLGLAATAVQAEDWSAAQSLYLRLLALNPRDTQAQAAVLSLQSNVDPVESEAMVRTLLRQEPKDPFLHFTLGNLFAEQQRWPEAQQAFFDAHRLDSTNPDYAFNLAVALDQLTQPASALDFYRRALELSDSQFASFQPELVLARIQTLSSGIAQ